MDATTRRIPRFDYLCDAPDTGRQRAHFGWRLAAANNRPLARAVYAHATLDGCRAGAAAVRAALGIDPESATFDVNRGRWSWRIVLDGRPAAVSVHTYFRRVECARGLSQFAAAIELADPGAGVVRHFGAHSLRAFVIPEVAGISPAPGEQAGLKSSGVAL